MEKHKYEEDQKKWNLAERIFEKSVKEDFQLETKRTLHLIRQHDLVGTIIAKAMENGEFDNLEGTGKPLDLDENPFEPIELRMANRVLKNSGFAPFWIETNKEIDALRAELDKEICSFKKYTEIVFSEKRSNGAIHRYNQKKDHFYSRIRERLEEISKKILDYNLHCPVSTLGRPNFAVESEMNRIVDDIEVLVKGL